MKYRCLVFDHDDTTVNSTATIHHPCFEQFLRDYYPGRSCDLKEYFLKNFSPGFLPMCREEYGMDDEMIELEGRYWRDYVRSRIPQAYPGIGEIMWKHRNEGGLLAVISHSMRENILRDYAANGLPEPDLVFGWEMPPEKRKPAAWPLEETMRRFSLEPDELLVIDDLKPGYDMAAECGVPFAAAGWANDIPEIEAFMRQNCSMYFKRVQDLAAYLQ
ncbi:MAG: HAD family hydrolase [Oscillospiraceae bacterium]|nr:HAD family hydrolase [Oscillospiraceae bacterium]